MGFGEPWEFCRFWVSGNKPDSKLFLREVSAACVSSDVCEA